MDTPTNLPEWQFYPLDIQNLSRIFKDTTNTYKFLFFISLLDLMPSEEHLQNSQLLTKAPDAALHPNNTVKQCCVHLAIPLYQVIWHMIELAYQPISEFKIRFPFLDRLPFIVDEIDHILQCDSSSAAIVKRSQALRYLGQEVCRDLYVEKQQRRKTWPELYESLWPLPLVKPAKNICPLQKYKSYEDFLSEVSTLEKYVPFRLLSPWIKQNDGLAKLKAPFLTTDKELPYYIGNAPISCMAAEYQKFILGYEPTSTPSALTSGKIDLSSSNTACLLSSQTPIRVVMINPHWLPYLNLHKNILQVFAYHKMAQKLEQLNPLMPALLSKLLPQDKRSSLSTQHKYFKAFIHESNLQITNIYTHQPLTMKDDFALDHFLPWSFVHHDLIWNLTPISQQLNSSKSNQLPPSELIFKLAEQHLALLRFHVRKSQSELQQKQNELQDKNNRKESSIDPNNYLGGQFNEMVSDFIELGQGRSIKQLSQCSLTDFYQLLAAQLEPAIKIAQNQGFANWQFKVS